jgi:hypothetical protein
MGIRPSEWTNPPVSITCATRRVPKPVLPVHIGWRVRLPHSALATATPLHLDPSLSSHVQSSRASSAQLSQGRC